MSWHRPTPEERQLALLWGIASVCSVMLRPLWLAAAPRLRPCIFRAITGIPCPTCGTTRAAVAVLELRLADAFAINPLATAAGLVFVVGGVAAALWALVRAPVPRIDTTRLPRWAVVLIVAVVLLNWIYLIATH